MTNRTSNRPQARRSGEKGPHTFPWTPPAGDWSDLRRARTRSETAHGERFVVEGLEGRPQLEQREQPLIAGGQTQQPHHRASISPVSTSTVTSSTERLGGLLSLGEAALRVH